MWYGTYRAQFKTNPKGYTHKLSTTTQMKNISIASLVKFKEGLNEASSKGKPYTLSSPSDVSLMVDEFIKIRHERDALLSEQEKLLKVLSALQTMAEMVQEIIQE